MNPPFIARSLLPSLSLLNIPASFESHKKSISNSSCAADALNGVFQSQQSETITVLDENSPHPSSCPDTVAGHAATHISANPRATQWTMLVSVGQKDNNAKASLRAGSKRSQSDTASSYTIIRQASLIPAQESVSLPHPLRHKLSLSESRDQPNSAPIMYQRPVTGRSQAGIFRDSARRDFSDLGNSGVAAVEGRYRRGNSKIGDDDANGEPLSQRKATLSTPHSTEKSSSPKLHFRGHSTSGTFTEWICREQSGFANPTFSASTQRWQRSDDTKLDTLEVMRDITVSQRPTPAPSAPSASQSLWPIQKLKQADQLEGQGSSNGFPTANSWEMNKSHVFSCPNCFDPIGNGFDSGWRTRSPGFGNSFHVGTPSPSRCDKASPSMAAEDQAVEAGLTVKTPDGVTPFPVPAGLIVASMQAHRARRQFSDEMGIGTTLQPIGAN